MDFGLFSYIKETVYGPDAPIETVGETIAKPEETVQQNVEEKTIVEEGVANDGKMYALPMIKLGGNGESVPENENVKVEETKVEETKVEEIKVEETKPEEVKVDGIKVEEIRPDEVETTEVREVKIIYHDQIRISIKYKYQVIPGTATRDGYFEEHYHVGMHIIGPLKSKSTYVNGKKHGYEHLYNMKGEEIKTDYYDNGEYVKTWYETIFGK